MSKKITTEEFIRRSKEIHGENKYDYSLVKYLRNKLKVKILCNEHGVFEQSPDAHLVGKGCKKCGVLISSKKRSSSENDFIIKSSDLHSNKYDYSKCNYISSNIKVTIICSYHGEFEQLPKKHLRGQGCIKCYHTKSIMTKDYFVNLANDKHNDVYDYTKTVYNGSKCDVLIICRIHGEFMKNANSHLRGSGCNMCVIEKSRKSKEDFIRSAKNKHNDRYNYDKSVYLTVRDKVIIECNIHGVFKQMPLSHIKGSGCPKCTNYISKPETEWLDSLNILEENRQYRIGRYKVDGFDPVTNNVYEFNGDYWHGNPNYYNLDDYNSVAKKTYGELYRKTLLKEKILSDKGYNVISIWGSDFKKIKTQL